MKKMKLKIILFITIITLGNRVVAQDENGNVAGETDADVGGNGEDDAQQKIEAGKNGLTAQLLVLMEHYKQKDPVGMPGAPIQDPQDIPQMKNNIGMGTMTMRNAKAYGLSKFRLDRMKVDVKAMKVEAGVQLDQLLVKGDYTMSSFFSSANGPFTVVLKKVYVQATASLTVERDGHLTTDEIKMDITFGDMTMDFQKLGFLGTAFQGIINSAPNMMFDVMKPFMLKEADTKIRQTVNPQIEKFMGDRRLPNSITPLDSAIAELRKLVRQKGNDPFHVADMNRTMGVFSVHLTNTWIYGISSFYRVGDIQAALQNNTVTLRFQVGTQQITGAGQWEVGFGLINRIGHVQFTVQHIRASVEVSYHLGPKQRATIDDLQLDMGNIQVRSDGAGTLDYVMEFLVNVLPNLLRYQIMDAIENPIKQRVQERFNAIDIEATIRDLQQYEKPDGSFDVDLVQYFSKYVL